MSPGVDAPAADGRAEGGTTLAADAADGAAEEAGLDARYDAAPMFEEATLVATPTAFTFPSTPVGDTSSAVQFIVSNIGFPSSGPVSHVIDGSSEFVTTSSTCGQPLAYQATCQVSVVFKPVTGGSKAARLIVLASPGKMFTVLLFGSALVPAAVRLDPAVYDFPTTPISPTIPTPMWPLGMFTLTNNGGTSIGPITVEITGQDAAEFAIAENTCASLQPGATCAVSVRFRPTAVGAKTALLKASAPGLEIPPATLTGIGAETAKITLSPLAQNFGNIPVGMKSAFSFDVTNTGGVDAGKINVSLEGLNISEFMAMPDASCNEALKPNFTCSITVTFAPTVAGTKSASLRVTASPGGFAKADLTASADTSTGQLSLTSPSPDPFGTVMVGDSSTGFFVVENKGTTAAGKVTASVSGSNASEFTVMENACPASLAPAGQCGVTVRFSPALSGRRTANLQVSAFPGGFATLTIAGNASAPPQLTISPNTRNFGNRIVGSQTGSITEFTVRLSGATATMTGPLSLALEGADAANFQLVYNDCQNTTLHQSRTSCRVGIRFVPVSTGQKTASLAATATPGGVTRATLYGNGT